MKIIGNNNHNFHHKPLSKSHRVSLPRRGDFTHLTVHLYSMCYLRKEFRNSRSLFRSCRSNREIGVGSRVINQGDRKIHDGALQYCRLLELDDWAQDYSRITRGCSSELIYKAAVCVYFNSAGCLLRKGTCRRFYTKILYNETPRNKRLFETLIPVV